MTKCHRIAVCLVADWPGRTGFFPQIPCQQHHRFGGRSVAHNQLNFLFRTSAINLMEDWPHENCTGPRPALSRTRAFSCRRRASWFRAQAAFRRGAEFSLPAGSNPFVLQIATCERRNRAASQIATIASFGFYSVPYVSPTP